MHRSDGIRGGADTPPPSDSLPALVGRLGEDLTRLVDSKLGLLKIEIRDSIPTCEALFIWLPLGRSQPSASDW